MDKRPVPGGWREVDCRPPRIGEWFIPVLGWYVGPLLCGMDYPAQEVRQIVEKIEIGGAKMKKTEKPEKAEKTEITQQVFDAKVEVRVALVPYYDQNDRPCEGTTYELIFLLNGKRVKPCPHQFGTREAALALARTYFPDYLAWRDATSDDVGKVVEVSNDGRSWQKVVLDAVFPLARKYRYATMCAYPEDNQALLYQHARVAL